MLRYVFALLVHCTGMTHYAVTASSSQPGATIARSIVNLSVLQRFRTLTYTV